VRLDGKFRKVRFSPPEFKVKYYSEPEYKGISENTLDVSSIGSPCRMSIQLHVADSSGLKQQKDGPVGHRLQHCLLLYCITAAAAAVAR
jgi:hypothetical protein